MGRFFETAPTQFVDNFIYTPPWELIQQNNMLEAKNYGTQQKTLNLIGNLPIDFWDKPDSELAKKKQEEYRNIVNPLVETLKKDPNNKEAEMQLYDISNKLYQDYTYGDLSKIKKNKEQYDKYVAYAEKLPPGEKEIFLRQADNYLRPNEDGSFNNALTKQFDYMEHQSMVTAEDFFKTDRFKTLQADIRSNSGVNIGGQWITKTSSNIEELTKAKIAEEMKAWVQEQGFDKNNAAKYWNQVGGIQNLYDKDGNLGFEKGTYFGDMIETGSNTHAYKKSKFDKDIEVNQIAESERNFKRQKALQKMSQEVPPEVAISPEAQKKVSISILQNSIVKNSINEELKNMGSKFGLKLNTYDIPKLIAWSKNNNKVGFLKSLQNYQSIIETSNKATLDPLYSMGYSKEYVDKYYNNLQKNMKTKGVNVPGILDFKNSSLENVNPLSKKLNLNQLPGKKLGAYLIESAQLVTDSSLPIIFSPNENYNKIQSTVKLKVTDGKKSKEVYVDFYQNSSEISGRSNLNN